MASFFAKKYSLLIPFLIIVFCNVSNAQIDITVGTGTAANGATLTAGYPCPLQDYYEGSRSQYLFRAAELKTAGMDSGTIYSISFNVTNLNGFSGFVDSLRVKVGNTTATALNGTTWATLTNAVMTYGAINYVPTLGKNTLVFTTPFVWNGINNIVFEICDGDPANTSGIFYSENVSITQSTTAFNSSHTYVVDNAGSLCGATTTANTGAQNTRPNFTFSWLPKLLCTGTPTVGLASGTPTTVCFGQNLTLSATGISVASGLKLQWEDSTATSGVWTPLIGATTKTFITTQITNTYYRLKVVCTNSSDSVYSNTFLISTPTLLGGIYTIDKTLPASKTNFISFNAAYNAMKCGIISPVIFNVANGPYTEQLIINGKIPGSGTQSTGIKNTITFNGHGETIKFSATTPNEKAVIKLKNTQSFIFDSLKIDASAATTNSIGIHLTNNADSNIIRNCTILSNPTTTAVGNSSGIAISALDNNAVGLGATGLNDANTIENNTITGGYYGVTLTANFAGGANGFNIIKNNIIRDFYRYGVYVYGSYNSTIKMNVISRPTRTAVGPFDGIYFAPLAGTDVTQSTNDSIVQNRIHSPFAAATNKNQSFVGINFDNAPASATNDNLVINNAVYGIVSTGSQVGFNNNASSNIWYLHNTISLDDVTSTATTTTKGFVQTGAAVSLVHYNNLISISRGGTGTKHCISVTNGLVFTGSDNNNYNMDAAEGNNYIGFSGTNKATLGAWQTATAQDANSLSIQPVYFLPYPTTDTSDYHPTNAAMNDKGLAFGIFTDIVDSIRNTGTPDMGAFEFTPPPCVPSSLNGTTVIYINAVKVVSDSTVCEGTAVNLGVKVVGPYGSAQTFEWQKVRDTAQTPQIIGPASISSDTLIFTNDSNYYYRCKISCFGNDFYTNWRLLKSFPAMPAGNYSINSTIASNYTFIPGGTFQTYDSAVKAMRYCGIKGIGNVVFNVVPLTGPYLEQIKIDSIKGATADRRVWFKGNNTTIGFTAAGPTNTERAVFKLTTAHYINLDSIVIDATAAGSFAYGVHLLKNADSNSVRNCTINLNQSVTAQAFAGIVVNGGDAAAPSSSTGIVLCDSNVFVNNTIDGGYYGIAITSIGTSLVENNVIANNKILNFYSTGILVGGTRNTIINGNYLSRPTRASVALGKGISYESTLSLNSQVSNNQFTSFYGGNTNGALGTYGVNISGVHPTSGNEIRVFNNAFYNLDGLGFAYPLYNSGSENVFYYHNSINLDNGVGSIPTGVAAGFYQTGVATGIQFKNNIVYINRAGSATKHCIYLNNATNTIESQTNVLYVDGNTTNGHIGYFSNNKTSFAAWQAAGFDASTIAPASYNYDPLYTNPASGDLKPQFYLIDNKGDNTISTAKDIKGVSRNLSTPDVGAFEFSAPLCPTPLLAGIASVTPSSGICLEIPINLSLTGNSPVGQINFQWQDSIAGGSWKNLGPIKFSTTYDTISSIRNYYRCVVTCAATGAQVFSTIAVENLNNLLAAGYYTIDSSKPTQLPALAGTAAGLGSNFNNFTDAINAMQCGILGSVVFDVQKGTFTEQIRVPYIPGTSANSTVTFQGNNGAPTDKILTWASANAAKNYVLQFDSCTYVTFKDLTIANTNTTYGRVVDFINKSSNDKLLTCNINTPLTISTNTTQTAVYSNATKGKNLIIKGNTITGGANGIYFAGTTQAIGSRALIGHIIDSNQIKQNYGAGIFVQFTHGLKVTRNYINYEAPAATGTAGIYASYCDSGFNIMNNKIDINNINAAISGIYVQNMPTQTPAGFNTINGNEVYANGNNTGKINGIYVTSANYVDVKNNVIAINSADSNGAYGLNHFNNTGNVTYYHNTVNITAPGSKTAAVQLAQTAAGKYILTNNIFSNNGGGRAMFMNPLANFTSDYNMLYTIGNVLVNTGTTAASNYANINRWRTASNYDKWSIVYKPAFKSNQDLHPDLNNPDVWAIQGRGIQIKNNITDINGNWRPDSLTVGTPDLGAYEFHPTALPTVLSAIPATPSLAVLTPSKKQVFYYGSDTVMRIKWDSANPPPAVEVRRYSGVVADGISASGRKDSMYFYTTVEIPGMPNYDKTFGVDLYYIDPWLGSETQKPFSEYQLGLAKTTQSNAWVVGYQSRNDIPKNRIYQTANVDYPSKFTGLFNPYSPPEIPSKGTSNAGDNFWVAYPRTSSGVTETYVLYLSAGDEPAYVHVDVDCENYHRTYNIPAHTVVVAQALPTNIKRTDAGTWCSGIHITSEDKVPIVAYAHCYGSASSGASLLLPVDTWGYEYRMLGQNQAYGGQNFSFYYVMSNNDNTQVEVTNTVAVQSPGTATSTVILNKGEWYQVLASSQTEELSGSFIKSVPNSSGKCYPIAVYSGSSRTQNPIPCGSGGDFMMQQNFPSTAWGKHYLTAPTSGTTGAKSYQGNLFRIGLKDVNTNVWINDTLVFTNGATQPTPTGIFNLTYNAIGQFIEYASNNVSATAANATTFNANYIKSNRPIMMAQYLGGGCDGDGDPEMMYISPIEQGINSISFYRNTLQAIDENVLTLIGSTVDTPHIVDGGTPITWSFIYTHPHYPGKSVYIKHWPASAQKQVNVFGDSTFTAITYGLGSVESYGYNAGTLVKNLIIEDKYPCNEDAPCLTDTSVSYTCSGTKFHLSTGFPVTPDSIRWKVSGILGMVPSQDLILRKPYQSFTASVKPNGDSSIVINLPDYYTIAQPGLYELVVKWWHPDIEGCDKSTEDIQYIQVVPSPKVGFTYSPTVICPNTLVSFNADDEDPISHIRPKKWNWTSNYGVLGTDSLINFFYTPSGTDTVKLHVVTADYCVGDSAHVLTINPSPVVTLVSDSINLCSGGNTSIIIQSPLAGATYTVYTVSTGGAVVASGDGTTPFVFNNVTSDVDYFIECVSATGCVSVNRKKVAVRITQIPLATAAPATITACIGTAATFTIASPNGNTVYNWFDVATNGTSIKTGDSLIVNPVVTNGTYYLEASVNGCVSATRFPVSLVAATTPSLAVVSNAVTVCSGDSATFSILNPDPTVTYNWYKDSTGGVATNGINYGISAPTQNTKYYVSATSINGCTTSPRLPLSLTATQRPVVTVAAPDSVVICSGTTQTFNVLNPLAGAEYNWYDASLAIVASNTITFTTLPVTGPSTYFVDGKKDGCVSISRAKVKVDVLKMVDTFSIINASTNQTSFIEFTWNASTGAKGYEISINDSPFVAVNNIPSVLHHTIFGLSPNVKRSARIKALGATNPCQDRISDSAVGKTVANLTYYPNTFTPSGTPGKNDKMTICGASFKEIQYAVFNQWGQKIWETRELKPNGNGCYELWDGTQNGVLQPAGVYIFASRIVFADGVTVETKQGSINLVR